MKHVSLEKMPSGFPALLPLIEHSEVNVRRLALAVVLKSRDSYLIKKFAQSSWQWTSTMNRSEAANGSLILVNATSFLSAAEIRRRVDPCVLGIFAIRPDADELDLDAFTGFVKERIDKDLYKTKSSRSNFECWSNLEKAVDYLIKCSSDDVIGWLQPLDGNRHSLHSSIFEEEFPYIHICRSLLRYRPKEGAAIWLILRDLYNDGIARSASILTLPFEVPTSPPVLEIRALACDCVKTDRDLSRIATAAIGHGQEDWMIAQILTDLKGASAGQVARGLQMAGLLDVSEAADELSVR